MLIPSSQSIFLNCKPRERYNCSRKKEMEKQCKQNNWKGKKRASSMIRIQLTFYDDYEVARKKKQQK